MVPRILDFSFPFISKASHREVLAAKDETITRMTAHAEHLQKTLDEERRESRQFAVTALAALKPAVPAAPVRRVRPEPSSDALPPAVPIDLTLVDPYDNEALAFIARQEMAPGERLTGTMMMRKIEHLRSQVVEAHKRSTANAMQPVLVPERIQDKIEAAIVAGAEQAKGA